MPAATLLWPGLHCSHTPSTSSYPASQRQTVCPVSVTVELCRPHAVHCVASAALTLFAPQGVHAAKPDWFLYVPAAQGTQCAYSCWGSPVMSPDVEPALHEQLRRDVAAVDGYALFPGQGVHAV